MIAWLRRLFAVDPEPAVVRVQLPPRPGPTLSHCKPFTIPTWWDSIAVPTAEPLTIFDQDTCP